MQKKYVATRLSEEMERLRTRKCQTELEKSIGERFSALEES